MAVLARQPTLAAGRNQGSGVVGFDGLASSAGCSAVLNDLLETPPYELGRKDFAVLNLLCSPSLPGSERLDIPKCLERLDRLTSFVKSVTDRNLYRFPADPSYGHSEPMWRMATLVTCVKRDFGAAYNPSLISNQKEGISEPLSDSRDVFINGLLDDNPKRRWGTCASIPALVTAIARRLRYPVGLAVAGRHIYARWEGRDCFDIEASNPMGMTIPSEWELREKIKALPMRARESHYYLRTLFPAEEFALFLSLRVELLICAARYEETLLWSARALQFAPEDPELPHTAHIALDLALKHRLRRAHPEQKIPRADDPNAFFFNAADLLRLEERSLCMTIVAHHMESLGKINEARKHYEDACRHNFHGNNEQRDLQRFLQKHGIPRRKGPVLPPRNLGQPRRFKLFCREQDEAEMLLGLSHQFERDGELVKARDALHDLYMFDPADAEVFRRARAIEQRPQFQEQFKAMVAKCRQQIQKSSVVSK